eukprot:SAG11_NODE_6596_length_1281_cov_5.016074_1_plen_191_part_00
MDYLAAASKAKKEAYTIRVLTPEETESNKKHSAHFEAQLPSKIDEAKVNQTVERYVGWVKELLEDKDNKYSYLKPIEKFNPLGRATEHPLVIEDKEGVSNTPPNKSYRTPTVTHLVPVLHKFIEEMVVIFVPTHEFWTLEAIQSCYGPDETIIMIRPEKGNTIMLRPGRDNNYDPARKRQYNHATARTRQ